MSYSALPEAERKALDETLKHLRSGAGTASQLSHRAAQILIAANESGAEATLQNMAPSELIPNSTDLSDAMEITAAEAIELLEVFQGVSDLCNKNPLFIKAAGVNAII
mgnify:CR=1 FL=1